MTTINGKRIEVGTPLGVLSAEIGDDCNYPEIIVELDGFQVARATYVSDALSADGAEGLSLHAWGDGGYEYFWEHKISRQDVLEWKEQLDG